MNLHGRITRASTRVALGATVAMFLWGCATVPSRYVSMSEPGLTLTELTTQPEKYRGKVVMLGGTIVEIDEHEQEYLLRVKNRPLDQDYIPHRPADMQGPDAGHYWITVDKRQLPREFRHWARMTVVGRITGTQRLGNEPVLALVYVRGWGTSPTHDAVWEDSSDPSYVPSVPAGIGGEFSGTRP